jgi:transcription initiation factor TFIIIB Brf1 subunit/transcription initiation factor TFIIB
MRCPNCDSENNEGARFCKKCGTPLKEKTISHESMINSMSKDKSSDNTTKYIIVALIVVAVVLAGAFVYLYGFGNNGSQDTSAPVVDNDEASVDNSEPAQASQSSQSTPSTSSMSIEGGSFSTGGGLNDKTYASIYVGPEHAGEKVKIQIFYSRDGSTLNNGNMVPKTVDSSGYIEVASADAYKYFPDYAEINLYDNSGNLLDTQSVSLSPEKGTQTF